MTYRPLSAAVSRADDERAAGRYERQASRSRVDAARHTRLAVDAAARGDDRRWRFERAQALLAWKAERIDLDRAEGIRSRDS